MSIEAGALVFFCCPKRSWTIGHVTEYDAKKGIGSCKAKEGGDVVAKLKEEEIFVARDDILDEDVDDLLHLTILHDSTLLACLRVRYFRDVIYTNIGAIVVAINPFNYKIPRYMDSMMPNYLQEGDRIERNIPHSWAVAHNTYHEMMNDEHNQCILVSGESGAGKTEASKIVMKYLANLSCIQGTAQQKQAGMEVGTKINACSPPLESFGNARTVRNDNSSRFGKFMKVRFNASGFLTGAHITKYLLEKSRIVTASPGERVYHSFYLCLRGSDAPTFKLGDQKSYRSVSAGKQWDNKEFNSSEEYTEVVDAMHTIGCTKEESMGMWRAVGALLHVLNVDFESDGGEGALVAAATQSEVDHFCSLLQVDKAMFCQELVKSELEIGGAKVVKLLPPVKAVDGRDALVKALYDNEFGWLVEKCNSILDTDPVGHWIGLLDIFGFEDFEINSFEQLCINLANETLQGHYNQFIFTKDMEECRAEGIDVTEVEFPDNGPCLVMMMGKGGICALLDEECALGKGSDEGFLSKICEKHSDNSFFLKKTLAKSSFVIHHYAGSVSYEVDNFLEKNRDTLKDSFKTLMRACGDGFVKQLLPEPAEKSGPKRTVGGFFKDQLRDLMELINSTNPHWIRCVKPHPAKKPLMMCGKSTMAQLASAGVLGTVKIRKAGFPVRVKFPDFILRYKIIVSGRASLPADQAELCKAIVAESGVDPMRAQVGTTRMFLKSDAYVDIENAKKNALQIHARTVQAWASALNCVNSLKAAVYEANKVVIDALRVQIKRLWVVKRNEMAARDVIARAEAEKWGEMLRSFHAYCLVIDRERIEAMQRAHEQKLADSRHVVFDAWQRGRHDVMRDEQRARMDLINDIQVAVASGRRVEQQRLLAEAREASRAAKVERQREREEKAAKVERRQAERASAVHGAAADREARLRAAELRRIELQRLRHQGAVQKAWTKHQREEDYMDHREGSARLGGGKVLSPDERMQRDQREWRRREQQKRRHLQSEYTREIWEQHKHEDHEEDRREVLREHQERQEVQQQVRRRQVEDRQRLAEQRRRLEDEQVAMSSEVERIREKQTHTAQTARADRERARRGAEKKEWRLLMSYFEGQRQQEQDEHTRRSKEFEQQRRERMAREQPHVDHEMREGWVPLAQRMAPSPGFVMAGGRTSIPRSVSPHHARSAAGSVPRPTSRGAGGRPPPSLPASSPAPRR